MGLSIRRHTEFRTSEREFYLLLLFELHQMWDKEVDEFRRRASAQFLRDVGAEGVMASPLGTYAGSLLTWA